MKRYGTFTYGTSESLGGVSGLGVCEAGQAGEILHAMAEGYHNPAWIADIPQGDTPLGRETAEMIADALNKFSGESK